MYIYLITQYRRISCCFSISSHKWSHFIYCRFINELIESLALASNESATDTPTQRIPDHILKRKSSVTGLEMIPLGTPEAKGRGSGLNPLQNDSVTILDTEGDAGASTKSLLSVEAKSSNEVRISFDSLSHKFCLVIWSNYGSPPMKMYRMEVTCAG